VLLAKIGRDEAESEGCGESTVEDDNEVWANFRRNPKGRGGFPPWLRRSSLKYTPYSALLAPRPDENPLPALLATNFITGSSMAIDVDWPCAMHPVANVLECVNLRREMTASPPGTPAKLLLDGVSFSLTRGEVLAVVGPSGAGKSTLLRLLNRLDEPTGGTVFFNGQDYREMDPRDLRRQVGMVMQRAFLFPGTIADNVRFGPKQRGITLDQQAVEALLAQVGLGGFGDRDALTLSGGEAQRVAITRALANEPEILLLDEPTSALDEAAKLGIEGLLESLIRQRHLTCVWVTHDAAQALRMADNVLMLEAGRMTAHGRAQELLHA
jgi:putative ABC transport system ATP-binding protein